MTAQPDTFSIYSRGAERRLLQHLRMLTVLVNHRAQIS